jgi:outer membrane protein insertion porin family
VRRIGIALVVLLLLRAGSAAAQPPPDDDPYADDDLRFEELTDPAEDEPPPSSPPDELKHDEIIAPEATPPARPDRPPRPAAQNGNDGTTPSAARGRLRYHLDGIEIRGNDRTADRVVLRYVPFRNGDVLDVDDPELELTRYRLLGTGFFSSVQLSLRKGSERGSAILVVEVVERNTFIVQNLWMGVAADEDEEGNAEPISAYVGLRAAETNLAGTGIALGAGIALAADQLSLRTDFADPTFAGTDWSATAHVHYIDARDFFGNRDVLFESPLLEQREVTDYAVVAYRRFGGSLGAGHDLSVSTQFALDYRLEQIDATVPTAASHIRGDTREPIHFDILPGESALSTLEARLIYDTRDAPFLPTRGSLASVSVMLGMPPLGSEYSFQRVEASAQHWWSLPWRHVVRAELFAGGIAGDAPFFEKYYVGDFSDLLPDRLLGLNPDRRQPPNILGTSIVEVRYGDFAAKLEGEYRIPLYRGRGSVYGIDLYTAGGLYAVATRSEFADPASGYAGFSKIPVDLTYNLGLRIDTSVGGLTVAFSNLLGLLPARGDGR